MFILYTIFIISLCVMVLNKHFVLNIFKKGRNIFVKLTKELHFLQDFLQHIDARRSGAL